MADGRTPRRTYWAENLARTGAEWGHAEMIFGVVGYFVIVIGLGEILDKPEVTRLGAMAGVIGIGLLLTCVTPRRMWNDSQAEIRRLERLLRPKLGLAFVPTAKPYFQEKQASPFVVERAFRIGIRNDSQAVVTDARVVIESCEPDIDEVWIERPLHVMGQSAVRDRCDVSPSDRPTAFVNFVYQHKPSDADAPGELAIRYASDGLPNQIPNNINCRMTLRVEGGGTFARREFRLSVGADGLLSVASG